MPWLTSSAYGPCMAQIGRLVSAGIAATFLVACASEEPEVSTASGNVAESDESSGSQETSKASSDDERETTTTARKSGPEVVVVETGLTVGPGYDGQPSATAGAVLRNDGDEKAVFFEVIFTFKDAGGTAVGTETTYLDAIEPGGVGHAAVDGVSLQGEAVSVDASAVVGEDSIWEGSVFPVAVTSVGPDQYMGIRVTGTADNPGDSVLKGGSVTCILRSGGRIVGGFETYLDTMTPGAQVAWEGHSMMEGLTADAAECSGDVDE